MSGPPDTGPPTTSPDGGAGVSVLVEAMEDAPAAIYLLTASADVPVWANARARALGAHRDQLPVLDGRAVADAVDDVVRTGRPETLYGHAAGDGQALTAVVRPLQVSAGPGALVVVEPDVAAGGADWPVDHGALVDTVQLSLLPPSLPLFPHLGLSGSYHRASSARSAGGDWYDAVPVGRGRLALVVGDAVGHGSPPRSP